MPGNPVLSKPPVFFHSRHHSHADGQQTREACEVDFSSRSAVDPEYYGIRYHKLKDREFKRPVSGAYYAVSLRYLPDVKWSDNYEPVEKVGNNIFIYYIEEERT